ncbi:universal stress protein [Daejeonella sp.]|jgi:nucleotide-binding universal stress UspA family protein|uniref:universal stress protein n=1 Tax=Daejeonella sp. TaxID=2805397 RepID=UPI0037C07F62
MISPENIHRILIAVDDSSYSEQAVNYGVLLAKNLGSKITLVHVDEIPISSPYSADPLLNESPAMIPELMHIQEEASKLLLKKIKDQYGDVVEMSTVTKIGRAQDEILFVADDCKADMIILGTHGRTGFDHFISGSVSESVARKAKCPVLIIPNPEKK